jgi:hypothetical protein
VRTPSLCADRKKETCLPEANEPMRRTELDAIPAEGIRLLEQDGVSLREICKRLGRSKNGMAVAFPRA